MKNKLITIAGAALLTLALAQTVQATTITGNIGFSGYGILNTPSANTATQITTWVQENVNGPSSGSFVAWVGNGDAVTIKAPWSFNSGAIAAFWVVDGFTFDLTSSSIFSQAGGFLNVNVYGDVSGNGFASTPFSGTFQANNPAADGQTKFNTQLSFGTVPDGGATVMLLGVALSGVALLRKKLAA